MTTGLQGFAPKGISRILTHAVIDDLYVGVVVLAALLEPLNELCEKKLEGSVPLPLKDVKQKPFLTW